MPRKLWHGCAPKLKVRLVQMTPDASPEHELTKTFVRAPAAIFARAACVV